MDRAAVAKSQRGSTLNPKADDARSTRVDLTAQKRPSNSDDDSDDEDSAAKWRRRSEERLGGGGGGGGGVVVVVVVVVVVLLVVKEEEQEEEKEEKEEVEITRMHRNKSCKLAEARPFAKVLYIATLCCKNSIFTS